MFKKTKTTAGKQIIGRVNPIFVLQPDQCKLVECLEEGKIDKPTKDLLDVNTGAE